MPRRRFILLAILIVPLLMLVGAAPPAQPPMQPLKGPVVSVICNDGKIVRGVLISQDPYVVTVQASAKTPPVSVPWENIKRLSNGATRDKLAVQWEQQHPEDVCPDCKGDGLAPCSTCAGTSFDPSKLTKCDQCNGTGVIGYCDNPRCEDGKVDCPRPCLKLSQGHWYMKEGKRWRDFRGRSGGFSVSESHLGQLIEMQNGEPTLGSTCPTCKGTTKVDCPRCDGTTLLTCPKCDFLGSVGPACAQCKGTGTVTCKTCNGLGLKPHEPKT
jgi:hypothetical protein